MFNLLKSQINSDLNRKLKIDRINPIMNQVYNQINEQVSFNVLSEINEYFKFKK